jgi:hypothetical protein
MTKEEVVEFIKAHLTIEAKLDRGDYGGSDSIDITLKLDGETVSSTSVSLPSN